MAYNITIKNLAKFTLKFAAAPLDTLLFISKTKLVIIANLKQKFKNRNLIQVGYLKISNLASLKMKMSKQIPLSTIKITNVNRLQYRPRNTFPFHLSVGVVASFVKIRMKMNTITVDLGHMGISAVGLLGKFKLLSEFYPLTMGDVFSLTLGEMEFITS